MEKAQQLYLLVVRKGLKNSISSHHLFFILYIFCNSLRPPLFAAVKTLSVFSDFSISPQHKVFAFTSKCSHSIRIRIGKPKWLWAKTKTLHLRRPYVKSIVFVTCVKYGRTIKV